MMRTSKESTALPSSKIYEGDIPIPISVVHGGKRTELYTHGTGRGHGDIATYAATGRPIPEKPLASGRNVGTPITSPSTGMPVAPPQALPTADYETARANAIRARNKAMLEYMNQDPVTPPVPYVDYSTETSKDMSQRINLLKNPNTDLTKLTDRVDGLFGAFYTWQQIKANVNRAGTYTPEQKQKIASNAFDRIIAPVNATGIKKDLWMKYAYDFDFDMEEAMRERFSHDSGVIKSTFRMLHDAVNAGKFIGDLFGVGVATKNPAMVGEWMKNRHGGLFDQLEQLSEVNMPAMHKFNQYLTKNAERFEFQESLLPYGGWQGAIGYLGTQMIPWVAADVLTGGAAAPGQIGMLGKAAEEFVDARQASRVYRMIGTARAGRIANGIARGARTGYIYGTLTRDQKDKNQAYKDAIYWGAMDALLHGGAAGIGMFREWIGSKRGGPPFPPPPPPTRITATPFENPPIPPPPPGFVPRGGGPGRRPPLPPVDERGMPVPSREGPRPSPEGTIPAPNRPAPGTAGPSPEERAREAVRGGSPPEKPETREGALVRNSLDTLRETYDKASDYVKNKLKLNKAGRTEANEFEEEEESESGASETVVKHGKDGLRILDNGAAAYLIEHERLGTDPATLRAQEIQILEHGTSAQRMFLDSVARLRSGLGNLKLSEMNTEQKQQLLSRLQALAANATTRMTKNVAVLQEALRQRFMAMPNEKLDKQVVAYLLQQVGPTLPQGATQEQVIKAVKERWADLVVQAGKDAEDELADDPLGKAIQANRNKSTKTREEEAAVARGVAATTKRWTNKAGEPAVSFSYSPQWTVYAKNAVARAGKRWTPTEIREWLRDLSEDDFAADIQGYFIPQFAPDKRLHLEVGRVTGGYDYTNLYAFAYNYKDSMPKEYADRLEEELLNSPKMKEFYDQAGAATPKKQLGEARRLALTMWNHVDDFLASGHFPNELNIFRSTQSDFRNPTKWQHELFTEREQAEASVIDKMYKKDTPANKAAHDALSVMFQERRAAFQNGDQVKRREISRSITERLVKDAKETKTKGYKDWGLPHGGEEDDTRFSRLRSVYTQPRVKPPGEMTTAQAVAFKREGRRLHKEVMDAVTEVNRLMALKDAREAQYGPNDPGTQSLLHQAAMYYRNIYQPAENSMRAWSTQAGGLHNPERFPIPVPYHGKLLESPMGHTAFMSYDAMQVVSQVLDMTQYDPHSLEHTGGMSTVRFRLPTLATRISQYAPNYPYKQELIDFINEAYRTMPAGSSLQFVNAGRELNEVIDDFCEEWIHQIQRKLGGGSYVNHLDPQQYASVHSAIPSGMAAHLAHNYPNAGLEEQVDEAAAKFLSQKASKFGCTEQERIQFIFAYLREIHAKHGAGAVKQFRTARGVAKQIVGTF